MLGEWQTKVVELEFKEKQALNNLYGNNANYANWYRSRYLQPDHRPVLYSL